MESRSTQWSLSTLIGVYLHSMESQPILGLLNGVFAHSMETKSTQCSLGPPNGVSV